MNLDKIRIVPTIINGGQPPSLRGVITDQDLAALRERNAQRIAAASEQLGERWVLYPTRKPAIGIRLRILDANWPEACRMFVMGAA